jgi:hypothetical protein
VRFEDGAGRPGEPLTMAAPVETSLGSDAASATNWRVGWTRMRARPFEEVAVPPKRDSFL